MFSHHPQSSPMSCYHSVGARLTMVHSDWSSGARWGVPVVYASHHVAHSSSLAPIPEYRPETPEQDRCSYDRAHGRCPDWPQRAYRSRNIVEAHESDEGYRSQQYYSDDRGHHGSQLTSRPRNGAHPTMRTLPLHSTMSPRERRLRVVTEFHDMQSTRAIPPRRQTRECALLAFPDGRT